MLSLAAGAWGTWRWYRAEPSALFWRLLRSAQAVLFVQVLLGGALLALGHHAHSKLHLLYGVLPLAVSFIAEQLRVGAADAVLAQHGFDSSDDVRALPEQEQEWVVLTIVRREMGVMTLAAWVILALALRAASTSGHLL